MKISVITVSYNSVKTIEETILSVFNQTYNNIEYIIIDGGSTDGTVDIIKKYADRLAYWVSESDQGMYDALAKGFEQASGDILCWLNADDLYYNGALSTVADFFIQNPHIKWLKGYDVTYNDKSQITGINIPPVFSNRLLRAGFYLGKYKMPFIQQESTFWRADLMKHIDMDRFRRFKLAGDYYLWFCFSEVNELHLITSYLGGWRRREGQLSSNLTAYYRESESIEVKKTAMDYIRYFYQRILYKLLRGSKIYRMIYKHRIHLWNISENRFV